LDEPISVTIDATAIPEQMTGVGRYVQNLVSALAGRDDVRFSVITKVGDRSRWDVGNRPIVIRDAAPRRRPVRLAWEQVQLPLLLSKLNPDVHHGTHYTTPRLARVPKAVTVHDMTLVVHPEWHEKTKVMFFRNAIKAALRSAAVIICVSQATADRLLEFGQPEGAVRVVPHGVDLDKFSAVEGAGDAEILKSLRLSGRFLAFVGTVEPRKGVPDLVRAFERVGGEHRDLKLVIAGQPGWGEAEADLEQAIAASELGDRIVRLGFVDDAHVAPILRAATAVVYPSLEEGFGLPVLEALACGAPTVTTTGSAMDEFAVGAALMVRPGDVGELALAIDSIVRGDSGSEQRRQVGLEVASRRSWAACAAQHVAAYRLAAGR
jgi:glycosyltransferase involved in cell wall biosynthesis